MGGTTIEAVDHQSTTAQKPTGEYDKEFRHDLRIAVRRSQLSCRSWSACAEFCRPDRST